MKIKLDKISTENRNSKTLNIDKVDSLRIVTLINNEDKNIIKAIKKQKINIANAIDACYDSISKKGRIFYIGAGTSGRIGVLDASEMPTTYGVSPDLFIAIQAGGDFALRNSVEKVEDDEMQSTKDLKSHHFSNMDILIGLSASGRSPYVKTAIEYANSLGAVTIAISTSFESAIGSIAKINIEPVTGAEAITGSTRMKSGSAQKMVLNMISTGVMIRAGKVYSNLMVDLKCNNEKLKTRAVNMVQDLTNADESRIYSLLLENSYNVKNAIICIKKNISIKEADELLNANNFVLSNII